MDTNTEVAGELRALLARRRISNRWVATQLGWSETYLSRRLTGAVPFNVDDLGELARLLDVAVADFFEPMPTMRRANFGSWTRNTRSRALLAVAA